MGISTCSISWCLFYLLPVVAASYKTQIFGDYGTSQTVLEASTWSTLILRHHLMPGVITLTIKVITPFMPVSYLFHKLKSGHPNLYHISYKICHTYIWKYISVQGGDFNMQHFLMYICKGKSCTYFRTLFYFLEHNIIIHKYAVS